MNRNIKPLSPFVVFCQKVIPLAFDESMSYYECLCALYNYLKNEVVPAVNNNADAVTALEKYVKNYFDNLDVQTEINNKLDEMAESGELANIISQYVKLQTLLVYNSVNEMKNATNLTNGSFAKTYGFENYNDGQGGLYKIRTITNTDVVDNKKIISLNDPTIIAELIILIYIESYSSVNSMINATNLVENKVVRTTGYYENNDGGGALYKIRKHNENDVTNSSTLILLNDPNYVAELIIENEINVKQFGAKGNGENDDTISIQNAFNYLRKYPRNEKDYSQLYFPNGEYLITDTIIIESGRWSEVRGRATLKANMNKPIIRLNSTMWYVFKDLLFVNDNVETNSSSIEIENSYTNKFTDITIDKGYKGINIIYGNQLIFDNVSVQNCNYGLYTTAHGNNTENIFNNCTFEGSSVYNIYLGFDNSNAYGTYIFNNCYIEGNTEYALIYIENAMRGIFNNCYIHNTKSGGTIIHQTGTYPVMRALFVGSYFTSNNGYLIKQLVSGISKGVKFDSKCMFDSTKLHNNTDIIIPSIGLINRNKLNIYNLTNFVADTNNKIIGWLGNSEYTLSSSIDSESVNTINITSQYIYKKIFLKAGVTYDFEVMTKASTGYSSIELFNEALNVVYFKANSYNEDWSKLKHSYTPTISQTYNLLIRSHNNTSSFCGLNIYSNELDLNQNRAD